MTGMGWARSVPQWKLFLEEFPFEQVERREDCVRSPRVQWKRVRYKAWCGWMPTSHTHQQLWVSSPGGALRI